MKFKLDENLSRSATDLFRAAGHDAVTVRDEGLRGAPDEQVFAVAVKEDRILVTLDRDLGQVLRFPPGDSAGVIVIEIGPRPSHASLLGRIRELLALLRERAPNRALWIIEPGRVRVHLAPVDQ